MPIEGALFRALPPGFLATYAQVLGEMKQRDDALRKRRGMSPPESTD